MIKRVLKIYAVPAIYILAIFVFGTSMYLLERLVNNQRFSSSEEKMEYVDKEIFIDNEYIPVINTIPTIGKPFLNENIKINKPYYDYEGEASEQEKALIYYEGSYIQNSGIDYMDTNSFDVVSILDGTVIDITENDILGKIIKIRHNNDLVSTYACLSETNVSKEKNILKGEIIGKSGVCSLYNNNYNLHLEITYQGKNINPQKAYDKTEDEL